MKLIFDLAKFGTVFVVRLLVLAALLGFGFLIKDELSRVVNNDPQQLVLEKSNKLGELRDEEQAALEAEQAAEQALTAARLRVERERQRASLRVSQAAAALRSPEADVQRSNLRVAAALREFGSPDSEVFASDRLVSTFSSLCKTASGNDRFCANLQARASAKGEPWYSNLSVALEEMCDWGGSALAWDALWSQRDVGGAVGAVVSCNAQKTASQFARSFATAASSVASLEQAKAAYKVAEEEFNAARTALDAIVIDTNLDSAYKEALERRQNIQTEIQNVQSELDTLARDPWVRVVEGWRWFYENILKKYWAWALGALLLPYLIAWVTYVLAGVARYIPKFRLRKNEDLEFIPMSAAQSNRVITEGAQTKRVEWSESVAGLPVRLIAYQGERQPLVELNEDEQLIARASYVASSRGGGSKWFLDALRPFSSYAAGMWALTRFRGSKTKQVVLSATGPGHESEYIAKVELENHPGFIVRPSQVIAVQGDLKLQRSWNFGFSSWFRFQFGYFYFKGTGSLYISAPGGVTPRLLSGSQGGQEPSEQLNHNLVLGWDGRLGAGAARNENVIQSAFLRNQDLFETSLAGQGVYLQGHSSKDAKLSGATKFLNGILDVFLKVFGV